MCPTISLNVLKLRKISSVQLLPLFVFYLGLPVLHTLLRAELHILDESIIHFEENSVFVNSAKISPHEKSTMCFHSPFRQYVPNKLLDTPELHKQPRIWLGLSLLHFVVETPIAMLVMGLLLA
jgi:hypothetical protein